VRSSGSSAGFACFVALFLRSDMPHCLRS